MTFGFLNTFLTKVETKHKYDQIVCQLKNKYTYWKVIDGITAQDLKI